MARKCHNFSSLRFLIFVWLKQELAGQYEKFVQQPFEPVKHSIQVESAGWGRLKSVLILCVVYQAACADWKIHCTLTLDSAFLPEE